MLNVLQCNYDIVTRKAKRTETIKHNVKAFTAQSTAFIILEQKTADRESNKAENTVISQLLDNVVKVS